MGTKVILCTVLLCALCGCSHVVEQPYIYISEGVYACGDTVWEDGTVRDRTPTDVQALQYITNDEGINLTPGELAYYEGTLYSLSNYRALLLERGYEVESEVRTSDVLDTTLSNGSDRVRLVYQPSGSIRILFENSKGAAHILLEEVQR